MAAQRVGVKMKAWARKSGIKHGGAHQPAPEQRAPIIRLRREGLIIEQAVVTCDQSIVGDDANILFREAAKLIEIAKRIYKRCRPRIAAARRISRLREPKRLAGFELVPQRPVERERFVRAPQPLLRRSEERRVGEECDTRWRAHRVSETSAERR